jgi:hypothetical protein
LDFFFVGTDELADKYPMMDGMFLKENDLKKIPKEARENLITVLNVLDRNSLAQITLPGDKALDEFKVRYVANVIDQWGHTTVMLRNDNEIAVNAIAQGVKKLRDHSTIMRNSPEYSHASMGAVEVTNGLAAGLLRTFRIALERKLSVEIRPTHPLVPFMVLSVGWYLTRFQPREHGGSSHKFLYGHEYNGEIAEFGELVWYRIAARVSAGRGKYEARFAKGVWVGKSEADDSHLVIDLERGVQKCRTARRIPNEFRWNADLVASIAVTPWNPSAKVAVGPGMRATYMPRK